MWGGLPQRWWARGTHRLLTGQRALVGNWVRASVANRAVPVNWTVGEHQRAQELHAEPSWELDEEDVIHRAGNRDVDHPRCLVRWVEA